MTRRKFIMASATGLLANWSNFMAPTVEEVTVINMNSIYLKALSEIESGNKDYTVGRHGERSRYQIKESTWNLYTKMPFGYAVHYNISTAVAEEILLDNINHFIRKHKRQPTYNEIYRLWRGGKNYNVNKPSKTIKESAQRFANLVEDFMKETNK